MGDEIYHVWFATKGRKHLLSGDVGEAAKEAIRTVAIEKGIDLLECEVMVEHVHLLVRPGRMGLPWTMKLLKGCSSYEVFRQFPELKLDAEADALWQRGYGAKLVPGEALEIVRRYVRTQDERLAKYEYGRTRGSRGF